MKWEVSVMKSKTFWYKKELGKQRFRQVGWIGFIYFLILFFAIPLDVLMQVGIEDYTYKIETTTVFAINPFIQLIILFIAPVLLAIFLFRFLQTKDAADFIHSLPIKRENMFYHQVIMGLSLLYIPVLVNAIILSIMSQTMEISNYFTVPDIGYWIGITLLLQTFIFASSVFVGMLTGISAIHAAFTYVFLFFPVGIYLLVMSNLNYALIGFPKIYLTEAYITELSPVTDSISMAYYDNITFLKILIYLVFILILFISSLFIYKKRHVEAATQAIAFRPLRPIFKYGFTFCITLIGGLYFGLLQKEISWIIFGYFIGSIFGYLIAQMILLKTWRVFGKWRGYLYFVIGFVLVFVIIILDVTGFEKKIPEVDSIESVYISENPFSFRDKESRSGQKGLSSQEEIGYVRALHEKLIEESNRRTDYQEYGYASNSLSIRYILKSGKELVRQYSMKDLDYYQGYLEDIYQLESYKEYANELFWLFDEEIDKISIDPAYEFNLLNETEILDKAQISKGMAALKKDILEEGYQEQRHATYYLTYVEFLVANKKNQYAYMEIKTNYTHFVKWLEDVGLDEQVIMSVEDITEIRIGKFHLEDDNLYDPLMYEDGLQILQIDDFSQMDTVIHALGDGNVSDLYGYGAAFYLKGESQPVIETIESNHVPDFVVDHFEQ